MCWASGHLQDGSVWVPYFAARSSNFQDMKLFIQGSPTHVGHVEPRTQDFWFQVY